MKITSCLTHSAILIAILMLILPTPAWAAGPGISDATTAMPGEILVGYQPHSRFAQQARVFASDPKVIAYLPDLTVALLRVPADRVAATLEQLRLDSDVVYAEVNGFVEGTWNPNDPYYNDPTKVYAPQQIKANLAWDLVRGSPAVLVAVIDSGADLAHPDLAGIFWINPNETPSNGLDDDNNGYVDDVNGWDFVNRDNAPIDDLGHGTHVTGIVAAQTNNGIGIAGIAGVKVLPVKVLNNSNQGTWADVAQGIIYATDQGARVINLSLGSTTPSTTVENAIQYAQSHEVLVMAAAGNSASNQPFYPAAYSGVVGIAATQPNNVRWSLSNYGSFVDLAAPGASVYSTYWSATAGSTYQFMSGTSMATPAAAGVAALVWSVNSALTANQITDILTQTATDLGTAGWDEYFGSGQVDAYAAVVRAGATLPGSSAINGIAWIDYSGDGIHDLNETQGLPGVTVELRTLQGATLAQTVTDDTGGYTFAQLQSGSYTVRAIPPAGYISTTPTEQDVNLGASQSSEAEFGFISPTAMPLQSLAVTPHQGHLDVSWQVNGCDAEHGWNVLRAELVGELLGRLKRINSEPVLGTWDGADSVAFQFADTDVSPGQIYWYWVQDSETGDLYGPVAGTLPGIGNTPGMAVRAFLPTMVN